jgi:hypothetical protein
MSNTTTNQERDWKEETQKYIDTYHRNWNRKPALFELISWLESTVISPLKEENKRLKEEVKDLEPNKSSTDDASLASHSCTETSLLSNDVYYHHAIEGSHFWPSLEMLINWIKIAKDNEFNSRQFLLEGLENTIANGYDIKYLSGNEEENRMVIDAARYGLWYATEVRHHGEVPEGNILQWLKSYKEMNRTPNDAVSDTTEDQQNSQTPTTHTTLQLEIAEEQIKVLLDQIKLYQEWIEEAKMELRNNAQKFGRLQSMFSSMYQDNWPVDLEFRINKTDQLLNELPK